MQLTQRWNPQTIITMHRVDPTEARTFIKLQARRTRRYNTQSQNKNQFIKSQLPSLTHCHALVPVYIQQALTTGT